MPASETTMTIRRIIDKLKSLKPWHFLWITIVLAEIFTLAANTIQSYLWWGFISRDLLFIGAIDAFFVAAVVAPIAIYFLKRTEEIKLTNERLRQEINGRRRAEEELEREKLFTEHALDALKELFFVLDFEGRFLRWNQALKTISGYGDDEIASMKPTDFFPAEEAPRIVRAIRMALKDGYSDIEANFLTKDQRLIPYYLTGSLIEDVNGKVVGICGVGTDVSERRLMEVLLRESEAKFRDMAERAMVGIYLIQDEIFRYVNPMLAAIFGYTVDEIIDKQGPEYLVLPEDWPIVRDNLRKRISGKIESVHYSFRGIRKDRETIHVEVHGSRTTYEARPAVIGTLLDITERKKADERIARQILRLSALRSIDLAISSSLDLRVTLKVFLEHVVTQLQVDAANVLLLNPHNRMLEYAARQGFRTDALKHSHLRLGEGYAGVAALENRIVKIPDLQEAGNMFNRAPFLKDEGFITYYGVPLVAKGHVKGVLEVFHRNPLVPDEEWFEFLDGLALQAAIAIDNNSLFYELERSNMGLIQAYDSTIEGWSRALDYRDKETEGHSQRVTELTIQIARELGMNEEELVHVRRGALLHDIGKMGIPDSILLKPGPLTEEEWKIMRLHPVYSYELLHPITYLRPALDIPYCHHEKWDGSGYPHGLKGEQIPLAARIFAIVDVWDALRSDRPYRPAWSAEKAKEHIRSLSGIQFDPAVLDVFLGMLS